MKLNIKGDYKNRISNFFWEVKEFIADHLGFIALIFLFGFLLCGVACISAGSARNYDKTKIKPFKQEDYMHDEDKLTYRYAIACGSYEFWANSYELSLNDGKEYNTITIQFDETVGIFSCESILIREQLGK